MFTYNATLLVACLVTSVAIIDVFCQECGKKHNTATGSSETLQVKSLVVVGGEDAVLKEFPWQVSLQYKDGDENVHFCGGSIIADQWVLSAAHCFQFDRLPYRTSGAGFDAVAGIVDRRTVETSEQRIAAVDYVMHEDFNASSGQNDIALIQLETAFDFGQFVEPICMPQPLQSTFGTATVTGWGSMSTQGPFSDVLQKLDMTVISDEQCGTYYPSKIVRSMICVANGGGPAYTGPCSGDSGGPLISYRPNDDSYYLSGVVSWGNGCEENYPAVLMEVSYFIDWINAHMTG